MVYRLGSIWKKYQSGQHEVGNMAEDVEQELENVEPDYMELTEERHRLR